jgi:hypothetical protein
MKLLIMKFSPLPLGPNILLNTLFSNRVSPNAHTKQRALFSREIPFVVPHFNLTLQCFNKAH